MLFLISVQLQGHLALESCLLLLLLWCHITKFTQM